MYLCLFYFSEAVEPMMIKPEMSSSPGALEAEAAEAQREAAAEVVTMDNGHDTAGSPLATTAMTSSPPVATAVMSSSPMSLSVEGELRVATSEDMEMPLATMSRAPLSPQHNMDEMPIQHSTDEN